MPKSNLRRSMLERRKALSAEELNKRSLLIQQKLTSTEEYERAAVVVLYSSIHNEVEMQHVIRHALVSGKRVLLPAVSGDGLLFRELPEPADMRRGKFGIMEPSPSCEVFDPELADIIVLPGLAFDLKGNRVGYGKGYYDKTLHNLEGRGKLVAVCYDFQLVDEIAGEPHDVKVDLIVTEKGVFHPINGDIAEDLRGVKREL